MGRQAVLNRVSAAEKSRYSIQALQSKLAQRYVLEVVSISLLVAHVPSLSHSSLYSRVRLEPPSILPPRRFPPK